MDKEWNGLRFMKRPDPNDKGIGVWDETRVVEYDDVIKRCRQQRVEATFARIAELRTEKNSELPKGHKARKFKGRAVYLGHNVRTHRFEGAVFQELGSNPPSMEAAKFLDAISCANGYVCKAGDATSAYAQAYLRTKNKKGEPVENWVELPAKRWPGEWVGKYRRPVVPLVLALYGHPESGGH